jgi:hypothetical protein
MIIGGGYFTRIFAAAVGEEGSVVAWQPAEFIAFQASYGESLTTVDEAYENVSALRSPIGAPEFPQGLDLVFTAQNYHDLHLAPFADDTAARVNAAVFAALKERVSAWPIACIASISPTCAARSRQPVLCWRPRATSWPVPMTREPPTSSMLTSGARLISSC